MSRREAVAERAQSSHWSQEGDRRDRSGATLGWAASIGLAGGRAVLERVGNILAEVVHELCRERN